MGRILGVVLAGGVGYARATFCRFQMENHMKHAQHRRALGIDFGGTSVKVAVVHSSGKIEHEDSFKTKGLDGVNGWLDAVEGMAAGFGYDRGEIRRSLAGIGVGVPGFVDFHRGYIYNLTNVPGWTSVELATILRRRFEIPAIVDNDCNAMAIGECHYGAGRGVRDAVFLTLGTGVGGGIWLDGHLYRGAYSMAGEIGHVSIDKNGVRTATGRGGLEQYVGNRQIVRRAVRALRAGRTSVLRTMTGGKFAELTPRHLAKAARKGDALALEVFDHMADCLATALASTTYLLQPQMFIIGGGVAGSGPVLFKPLRAHLKDRLSPYFATRIEVRAAELGNHAGVVGAASLALH